PRWALFVERHPAASAFHAAGWMRALAQTYGYRPAAATSAAPGAPLTDAVPFCRIESWATGRRMVSLPFTDHCQPLLSSVASATEFVEFLADLAKREKYKSFELRPAAPLVADAVSEKNQCASYFIHWLDLTSPAEEIFKTFQKDSIQRK